MPTLDNVNKPDWTALAGRVRERRVALGLRQSDLEAVGGPSNGTVRNIEQEARTTYSTRTFAQLENALGWNPGTVARILKGEATESTAEDRGWALAAEVRKRRSRLRLPIDLTSVGGPSEMTVRKIETGEPGEIRPQTKTRLEYALRMSPGLVDRILDGTATEAEIDQEASAPSPRAAPTTCACVVGSPAWIERELATERRINAIAQVFQAEVQRLLVLVDAARST